MQRFQVPVCDVCRKLVTEWVEAQRQLFTTEMLSVYLDDPVTSGYKQRRIAATDARIRCERARKDFEFHRTVHARAELTDALQPAISSPHGLPTSWSKS